MNHKYIQNYGMKYRIYQKKLVM